MSGWDLFDYLAVVFGVGMLAVAGWKVVTEWLDSRNP